MTKKEALLFLDSDEENWEDDLELKLFELKKDLLRRALIPKLLNKKAEKVSDWYRFSHVLLNKESKDIVKSQISLPIVKEGIVQDYLALYRFFESELMKLQLKLSQSNEAKIIAEVIYSMAQLESDRQQIILPIAKRLFSEGDKSGFEVKLSEDSQTGVIISELKQCDKEQITEKKDLLLLPNFEKDLQRILKSN
jgi:hypothetical protein